MSPAELRRRRRRARQRRRQHCVHARGDDDAADGGGADGVGRGGTAQAGVPAPAPVSTDFLATEVRPNLRSLCWPADVGYTEVAWMVQVIGEKVDDWLAKDEEPKKKIKQDYSSYG